MKRALVLAALLAATSAFANDIDPFGFEKEHFQTSKSHAEATADFKAAQAAGQLPKYGEVGIQPAETKSTKTRSQVAAETREAARLGLLSSYGEAGPKQPTADQEHQIELAGMRALEKTTAAK
jgi:hypothetical protein